MSLRVKEISQSLEQERQLRSHLPSSTRRTFIFFFFLAFFLLFPHLICRRLQFERDSDQMKLNAAQLEHKLEELNGMSLLYDRTRSLKGIRADLTVKLAQSEANLTEMSNQREATANERHEADLVCFFSISDYFSVLSSEIVSPRGGTDLVRHSINFFEG